MRPIILYRDFDMKEELVAAKEYFGCTDSRMDIKQGDLVIGRYSLLPYYEEQERDIEKAGAKLINSYSQHLYVADMKRWYEDLYDLTPHTWFRMEDVPDNGGPFVLKGKTNSRKHKWNTMMYAGNKKEAIDVYCRLLDDSLIGQQDIYIREYVPLVKLCDGINGLPISEEYRIFVAYNEFLTGAFYWSSHVTDINIVPSITNVPPEFIDSIIKRIGNNINFYVIDVARTRKGEWILVELNDGCMSGLSENRPEMLYGNLKKVIDNKCQQRLF